MRSFIRKFWDRFGIIDSYPRAHNELRINQFLQLNLLFLLFYYYIYTLETRVITRMVREDLLVS